MIGRRLRLLTANPLATVAHERNHQRISRSHYDKTHASSHWQHADCKLCIGMKIHGDLESMAFGIIGLLPIEFGGSPT